jgi:hypothetical protein
VAEGPPDARAGRRHGAPGQDRLDRGGGALHRAHVPVHVLRRLRRRLADVRVLVCAPSLFGTLVRP